ncbi:hypothetical protein IV203_034478 [Nitzschia inconspicua]|uniref:Uncharacterized protein n=1 Tax=Nitzschia inconspicua TaxID=303405 RepID=A0A9K3K9C0_9STRA|nr:hypothetical protein IV203_002535 [Nitzschia inconspicua]KAG7359380.1 hypothetical protein IV203_034478 [Nitzschia inconspicua]
MAPNGRILKLCRYAKAPRTRQEKEELKSIGCILGHFSKLPVGRPPKAAVVVTAEDTKKDEQQGKQQQSNNKATTRTSGGLLLRMTAVVQPRSCLEPTGKQLKTSPCCGMPC